MDPNANIKEQLKLAEDLLSSYHSESELDPDDVARLCELVEALDQWLANGGFLPARWERK